MFSYGLPSAIHLIPSPLFIHFPFQLSLCLCPFIYMSSPLQGPGIETYLIETPGCHNEKNHRNQYYSHNVLLYFKRNLVQRNRSHLLKYSQVNLPSWLLIFAYPLYLPLTFYRILITVLRVEIRPLLPNFQKYWSLILNILLVLIFVISITEPWARILFQKPSLMGLNIKHLTYTLCWPTLAQLLASCIAKHLVDKISSLTSALRYQRSGRSCVDTFSNSIVDTRWASVAGLWWRIVWCYRFLINIRVFSVFISLHKMLFTQDLLIAVVFDFLL